MGRLFHTESGRALLAYNEEVTRWRWARKRLKLPAAAASASADLWLCIYGYKGNREPLVVHVNGRKASEVSPDAVPADDWGWQRLPVRAGRLRAGVNEIVLRSGNEAMNGWMLAIENGYARPGSAVSFDRGKTWRSDAMGAHGALRGEYVIRLRSHAPSLKEPAAPKVIYENPKHPRVREMLAMVPGEIKAIREPWAQVLALRNFVSRMWTHRPYGGGYAPWDPATIVAWAKSNSGHGQKEPIVMCVHFGAVMTALAAALGHGVRCAVITADFNAPLGHFVSEIYDRAGARWVMHDANLDLHFEDGRPLSLTDLSDRAIAGRSCAASARPGPGLARTPHLQEFYRDLVAPGKVFLKSSVWSRNDYISNPASAPPAHGSLVFQETAMVWYNPVGSEVAPMFPYSAGAGYFAQPPGAT